MLRKGIIPSMMIALLFVGLVDITFYATPVKANPDVIEVPTDYPTIQAAINAANPGDTIMVLPDTYFENVVVNKTVSLLGESSSTTIIDGSGTGPVVYLKANNTLVSGFTLQNGDYGIFMYLAYDNTISKNKMLGHAYEGVHMRSSGNNSLIDNYVLNNQQDGIFLYENNFNNSLIGNYVANNGDGISLVSSNNNSLISNYITNNTVHGISLSWGSSNNSLIDNYIHSNNLSGIHLGGVNNNSLVGNYVQNNNWWGITLAGSFNSVVDNYIAGNEYGTRFHYASDNSIYHNNFVDNTWQVVVTGPPEASSNVLDDGYPSGGNYWSDYSGVDLYKGPSQDVTGSDGIGDTPYTIDANNQDNYPLMTPFGGVTSHTQTFYSGSNDFSLALNPLTSLTADSLMKIMNAQGGNVTSIGRWNGTDWLYFPENTEDFSIKIGKGYDLINNEIFTFTLVGTEISSVDHYFRSLPKTNFVGFPMLRSQPYNATTLAEDIDRQGGNVAYIMRWDVPSQGLVFIYPNTNASIERGRAYLIASLTNSSFTSKATAEQWPKKSLFLLELNGQTQLIWEDGNSVVLEDTPYLDGHRDNDFAITSNGRYALFPITVSPYSTVLYRINMETQAIEEFATIPGTLFHTGIDITVSPDDSYALFVVHTGEVYRVWIDQLGSYEVVDIGYGALGVSHPHPDVDIVISPDGDKAIWKPWKATDVRLITGLLGNSPTSQTFDLSPLDYDISGLDPAFDPSGRFVLIYVYPHRMYFLDTENLPLPGSSPPLLSDELGPWVGSDRDIVFAPNGSYALFADGVGGGGGIGSVLHIRMISFTPTGPELTTIDEETGFMWASVDLRITPDSRYAIAIIDNWGESIIKRYDFSTDPPTIDTLEDMPGWRPGAIGIDPQFGMDPSINASLSFENQFALVAMRDAFDTTTYNPQTRLVRVGIVDGTIDAEIVSGIPIPFVDFAVTPSANNALFPIWRPYDDKVDLIRLYGLETGISASVIATYSSNLFSVLYPSPGVTVSLSALPVADIDVAFKVDGDIALYPIWDPDTGNTTLVKIQGVETDFPTPSVVYNQSGTPRVGVDLALKLLSPTTPPIDEDHPSGFLGLPSPPSPPPPDSKNRTIVFSDPALENHTTIQLPPLNHTLYLDVTAYSNGRDNKSVTIRQIFSSHLELNNTATVSIRYTNEEVAGDERALAVFWFNMTTGQWIPITNSVVDAENNTVTVQIKELMGLLAIQRIHDVRVEKIMAPATTTPETTISINVTIANKGFFTETFNISVYYTRIADPLIGTQNVTLEPGANTTLTFKWTPNMTGRYQILANTTEILYDFDPTDNTRTTILYVGYGGSNPGSESVNGLHMASFVFAMFASIIVLAFRKDREMPLSDMPASILKQNLQNNQPSHTTNMWQDRIRQQPI